MIFSHSRKWDITFKVLPFALLIIVLKFIAHALHLEYLSLIALFTAVVSADIFLLGFLISGVLSDFKDAEGLPGEMAACLESLLDECAIMHLEKKSAKVRACHAHIVRLIDQLDGWFFRRVSSKEVFDDLTGLNHHIARLEEHAPVDFLARMKGDQSEIRHMVIRIHTIRDVPFSQSAYAISEIITGLLLIGLVVIQITPFVDGVAFAGFVSFVLVYMNILIRHLDHPFDYTHRHEETDQASLKPFLDLKQRVKYL